MRSVAGRDGVGWGGSLCDRTLPGRCRALGPQNQTNNMEVYVLKYGSV